MTLKFLITLIVCALGSYSVYAYRNYQATGGYAVNSDEYNGYRYFTDNNAELKSCDDVNTEFGEPASKGWMEGCNKYLETHKKAP